MDELEAVAWTALSPRSVAWRIVTDVLAEQSLYHDTKGRAALAELERRAPWRAMLIVPARAARRS